MGAVAPPSIYKLWDDVSAAIPQAVLSGIVGDVAHSFGYHLARNDLPSDDYSVILPADRLGSGANASALDVSLPPDLMVTVTGRLLAAAKAGDPRLRALREFCGTTNGTQTHPYDLSNGQDGPLDSWDSSHLWHVHLSFYREFADDYTALAPIAQVMAGVNSLDPLEQIMSYYASKADFEAAMSRLVNTWNTASGTRSADTAVRMAIGDHVDPAIKLLADMGPRVAAIQSAVASVAKTLGTTAAGVTAVTKAVAAIVPGVVDVQTLADAVSAKVKALAWKAV